MIQVTFSVNILKFMEKCHYLYPKTADSQNPHSLRCRVRQKILSCSTIYAIMPYAQRKITIRACLKLVTGISVLLLTNCIPVPVGSWVPQSRMILEASTSSTASSARETLTTLPVLLKTSPVQPTKTGTPTPLPSPTPTLPPQAHISLKGKSQTLPLSCEARSAVDWAAYFGVTIEELAFQQQLPRSDNPEEGYVGDVGGVWGLLPPRSYGVHAPPVAALLRKYGLAAQERRKMTLEELKREIAAGQPVIVWVTGHVQSGTPSIYTTRTGHKVRVAAREHTVIVVGYTAETIIVVDGALTYGRATQNFLESWNVLDNMAIVLAE